MAVISVILVNFNDRLHMEPCLAALRASRAADEIEIIVVDNGSTDGSSGLVADKFPEARWIDMGGNAGFSRASNRGAGESRGDLLLFLNTDTVLPDSALAELSRCLRSDPGASAAGPALLHGPGRFQVSFGRSVSLTGQFVQKFFVNPYQKRALRRATATREVGWLSAACLLCRRGAFEGIGGFDEGFFMYFEDIDLCYRLREAGGRLLFVPAVRVAHVGGATTALAPAASRLEYRKSQVYFYRKHRSTSSQRGLNAYLRLHARWLRARGVFQGEEGGTLQTAYDELLGRKKRTR